MSSIIVFGTKLDCIDEYTKPDPDNFYGDSKLQAERGIEKLQDDKFKVAMIRPPMVYGEKTKGNYPKLAKIANNNHKLIQVKVFNPIINIIVKISFVNKIFDDFYYAKEFSNFQYKYQIFGFEESIRLTEKNSSD